MMDENKSKKRSTNEDKRNKRKRKTKEEGKIHK